MNSRALVSGILGLFLNLGILFAQEATEKPIVAAAQMWLHEIDSGHYAELATGIDLFSGSDNGEKVDGCFEWSAKAAWKSGFAKSYQNPQRKVSSRRSGRKLSR